MGELEELKQQVQRLTDRIAVGDMLPRFAAAMDSQDEDTLRTLFAEDVLVESPKGAFKGRDGAMEGMRNTAFKHAASQHLITPQRVTIEGDRASAVYYFHSVHSDEAERPDVHADHGGWYLVRLRRSGASWLITYMKQVSVWQAEQMPPKYPLTKALLEEMRQWS